VSRGVLVLGMHRSGTSAATGVLRMLGLELLGDDLLPADRANPRGYWESASLMALNDEILDALGYSWTCPPPAGPGWTDDPALIELAASMREGLAERFRGEGWLWKDPRNCVTLPFWLRATAIDPVVVLVHRDPVEVARSLAARDGIEEDRGLALWERYVRHALVAAEGRPTFVCDYAVLLDDPVGWTQRVGEFLAGHGLRLAELDEHAVAAFVDPELRRARADRADDVSSAQGELLRLVESLRGPHAALAEVALPPETPGLDGVFARRRRDDLRAALAHAAALDETLGEVRTSKSYRYTAVVRWLAGRVLGARA